MKYLIVALFILSSYIASAQCARSGEFVANDPDVYPVSGTALIEINEDDELLVVFDDDFKTIQGATLNVYLSKTGILNRNTDVQVSDSPLGAGISLGGPIEGRHEFSVPDDVDFDEYDYVLIWCEGISELWGNVAYGEAAGAGCPVTSSVKELDAYADFQVTPNPVVDELQLSNIPFKNYELEIIGQDGRRYHPEQVPQMSSGIYHLVVTNGAERIVRRFVKQ